MRGYIAKFLKWVTSFFEIDVPSISVNDFKPVTKDEVRESLPKEPEPVKEEIKPEEDDFSIYHPKERLIYKYWNGKELIAADPMTLYKKVMDVSAELAIHFSVAKSQSKDAKDAHENLIETVRKVFGVRSLEETPEGLGQTESISLLNHFLAYCNRLKKNSRTFATTSKLSEDSQLTSENAQPTSNISDSGSTENVPSSEKPLP